MRISDWSSDVCSSDLSLSEIHALARSELRKFADIQTELGTFLENLLALYRAPDGAGLLILCTAPAEAEMRPGVGEDLRVLIAALDQLLESRLEAAAAKGELWPHITPAMGAHATRSEEHTSELRH